MAEELLNIAREVGLREVMHGVNSQVAMKLLSEFANLAIDKVIGEPVGMAGAMPGTSGFTMAAFKSEDVPVGTELYALKEVK